ncbi:MAG: ABC transporter ATP-binding protein [Chitinophagaceae bacterium]|nr:MAG: ABC transporter ATP-binding protein [Chitinophagaceae bacterium]
MASAIISTSGLIYHYSKAVQTLHDINLQVDHGSIYGFLGPNGSGKTTTLSLILGLLKNQQGSIKIFDRDLDSNRCDILKKIGSLIEAPSLYGHLTAKENLEIYRSVYNVSKSRVDEVLRIVGLGDTKTKTVKSFSLGMRQRLAISLALLPDPELLILDEPSNGLDPGGIIELRQLIKRLNKECGMTVVISSHLLGEVEKMVSHVGIIYKGSMLFQGTLSDLHIMQQKGAKVVINTSDNHKAIRVLNGHLAESSDGHLTVPFRNFSQVAAINRLLTAADLDVFMLHPKIQSLEQLFIDLTSDQTHTLMRQASA